MVDPETRNWAAARAAARADAPYVRYDTHDGRKVPYRTENRV